MQKIWIVMMVFVFAGCQPEAQESVAPPVVAAPADAQETVKAVPLQPAEQQQAETLPVTTLEAKSEPAILPPVQQKVVASPKVEATEAPLKKEATIVAAPAPQPQAQLSEPDAIALAKKKNCFACHALDKKMVGPAWRAVAQKYRGEAGAQAMLETKVRKGGKGVWGGMAMPAQPALSPDELTGLVQFVLQLN